MKLPNLKKFVLDTFFPQFCLGCSREGSLICDDCLSLVPITDYQYCPFCHSPNRVMGKGKCSSHRQMQLDGLFAATSYQEPLVKKLITSLKYKPYTKTLAEPLAYLIIAYFALSENRAIFRDVENSLLVPVPLSRSKQKERGFNQAELLAEELSRFFKIPLLNNNLVKIKKTQSQTELKKEERAKNIQGAFAVKPFPARPRPGREGQKEHLTVQGKKIFLVDDVFTTGATMEECARVLKQAGAREVWGITVAREPLV